MPQIQALGSGSNIFCDGYLSCEYVPLIEAENSIYCQGYASCYASDLYNARNVYCSSTQSCEGANLYGITNIHLLSYQIYSMNIDSNGIQASKGENMTVNILTDAAADNLYINCASNDVCIINCIVGGACSNSFPVVTCSGNCFVCCNDSAGIRCGTYTGNYQYINDSQVCDAGNLRLDMIEIEMTTTTNPTTTVQVEETDTTDSEDSGTSGNVNTVSTTGDGGSEEESTSGNGGGGLSPVVQR